jgi:hypothetical protein
MYAKSMGSWIKQCYSCRMKEREFVVVLTLYSTTKIKKTGLSKTGKKSVYRTRPILAIFGCLI